MHEPLIEQNTLPLLTAELPGVGGVIKRSDEDFDVEEIPRYEAGGKGTHIYFTIEKRGLTTLAAIRAIAQALGRRSQDIGYAGMKDAHAVTRQRLSLEHIDPGKIERLEVDRVRILSMSRHTNKIKLGHLSGNRFAIKIRDTDLAKLEEARTILNVLAKQGAPNYFGPQRFGVRGDNARVGHAVLRGNLKEALAWMLGRPTSCDSSPIRISRELFDTGDFEASARAWPAQFSGTAKVCRVLADSGGDTHKAWRAVDHSLRRLYISAVQSELFNQVLSKRIGSIDRLYDGDVAWKHANGACFLVESAVAEQPRCDAFEISPTGPLFGKKMREPEGTTAQIEADVLATSRLGRDRFHSKEHGRLEGARRPLRVPMTEASIESETDEYGAFLLLRFCLPAGAYATNVTSEVCKSGPA